MNYILNVAKLLFLSKKAIEEIKENRNASTYGFLILIVVSIISFNLMILVSGIILFSIMHFIAKRLGGKSLAMEFFRPYSTAFILHFASFLLLPFQSYSIVSFIIPIWILIIFFRVTMITHEISAPKSFGVILIPAIITLLILPLSVSQSTIERNYAAEVQKSANLTLPECENFGLSYINVTDPLTNQTREVWPGNNQKEFCYKEYAVRLRDERLCYKSINGDNSCFSNVALAKREPTICNIAPDPEICYAYYATAVKDKTVCDNLDSIRKAACLQYVK